MQDYIWNHSCERMPTAMSNSDYKCVLCDKECKLTDSRPYPNNQSKEYIHNRCRIKKNLSDKCIPKSGAIKDGPRNNTKPSSSSFDLSIEAIKRKDEASLSNNLAEKRSQELEERLNKSGDGPGKANQFFFDLKAGIARPNEKRQYLHHRKLCEIVSRYDDNGFQQEKAGRAYDHTGKDLNTLGDDDESDGEKPNEDEQDEEFLKLAPDAGIDRVKSKRTIESQDDVQRHKKLAKKGFHIKVDQNNPCWFCLSSPNVEKHLIFAIGEYCYLTLAKGGLTDDHLLVIPIEHYQATIDRDNSRELLEELDRFKSSLVKLFERHSKGVVFFERNFRSVHWQLQVIPVPNERMDDIENKIKSISSDLHKGLDYIDIPKTCSIRDMVPSRAPYMFWQIEPLGKQFVSQISVKNDYFPLQLGRTTLAAPSILDKEDYIDWKKCVKSKDDYIKLADELKSRYSEFDFTQ